MDPISALKPVDAIGGVGGPKNGSANASTVGLGKSGGAIPNVATPAGTLNKSGSTAVNKTDSADAINQLKDNVDSANARLSSMNQRVDLSVDKDTGQVVVKVSNTSTGEVVSQIPSENALKLAKSLDSLTGILVDKKS